ncbi:MULTISPECIES: stage III sporulation protein AD [Bacillaceae]|uniref:stage III sporulation protein AD n=1 Tax=Bacillaceae TaxID=186817 RepID=UPI001FE13EDC|nr:MULTISPECIES: stage III sporulation protein AD [Bacillaceae]MCM3224523.1 stage III sporulation protein AD [Terribacillus saccharophilus]MEC0283581.1 stage III sporulation protein AD [Terribacillus saccharophilus]MEC0290537.1 stage III sporulation protein AD [Terribacillus saccharophilus]MEC0303958.1 stage III sporulation protein AD [Terribacillus saccharophilus]
MKMDIIIIVSIGIVASLLALIVKEQNSSIAFFVVVVTGIIIFLFILQKITGILLLIEQLGERANVEGLYIKTILKIIGIAYITEFGAHLTRDAGLSAIAAKIELAGKIIIITVAIPILTAVIETIMSFMPGG